MPVSRFIKIFYFESNCNSWIMPTLTAITNPRHISFARHAECWIAEPGEDCPPCQFAIMAAANLGNFERFKKPSPPATPSIATSDDLVDLRRKYLMEKPLSAKDIRHHGVFDAKTETELRRKRAEREMWLDEACRNFVHSVIDAASGTSFAQVTGEKQYSRSYSIFLYSQFPAKAPQKSTSAALRRRRTYRWMWAAIQ